MKTYLQLNTRLHGPDSQSSRLAAADVLVIATRGRRYSGKRIEQLAA
jgi:hypothetical protein